MSDELNNATFQDEAKAREWLEAQLWPDGPICGHCGTLSEATGLSTRPGWYQCNACRKQFSVTVGTLFERSHIPLNKWLMAAFLICASKKGMSTHQLHRMLGVSYKSTWFMMHRIREAMREGEFPPLGGEGKFVEADETFTGGQSQEPRLQGTSSERTSPGARRARRQGSQLSHSRSDGRDIEADHRRRDRQGLPFQNRLERRLLERRRAICQPSHSHSFNRRVCPWRCAHEYHRRLLFDPQARDLWNLSSCFANPPEALSRRIRFPIQLPHSAWLYRPRAHDDCTKGHRR
jgi:transposase-like protein